MTTLDATFDVAHPSDGQVGKMRRRWDELAADPHHLAGAITTIKRSVGDYRTAAERTDLVAQASAPLLAVQVVDQVGPLIAVFRAELAEVRAHLQLAVHAMQQEERRADEGDDVIRATMQAVGDHDEAALERAVVAGISHLHEPCRDAAQARLDAVASALEAAAYAAMRAAERLAAVPS